MMKVKKVKQIKIKKPKNLQSFVFIENTQRLIRENNYNLHFLINGSDFEWFVHVWSLYNVILRYEYPKNVVYYENGKPTSTDLLIQLFKTNIKNIYNQRAIIVDENVVYFIVDYSK